jgi:hypothetical protein
MNTADTTDTTIAHAEAAAAAQGALAAYQDALRHGNSDEVLEARQRVIETSKALAAARRGSP